MTEERETLLRDFERGSKLGSKLNNYLVSQISLRYENNGDPPGLWAIPDSYKKIDEAMIQNAAKKYSTQALC